MRFFLLFLIFLLFISFVAPSKTVIEQNLNHNSSITVYGKTLTILKVNSADKSLKVNVDGVKGIVKFGKMTNVNEMFVTIENLTYVDETESEITLNITVRYECGDDSCNDTENSVSCCTDCGCEEGACFNNICQLETCILDTDCEDDDPCTLNECKDSPRECVFTPVEDCLDNDSCCPSSCDFSNDNDCSMPENFCESAKDCDNDNPCTKNSCVNSTCLNEQQPGCILKSNCVPPGAIDNYKFCSDSEWFPQRDDGMPCANDFECLSGKCEDICRGSFLMSYLIIIFSTAVVFFVGYFLFVKKKSPLSE